MVSKRSGESDEQKGSVCVVCVRATTLAYAVGAKETDHVQTVIYPYSFVNPISCCFLRRRPLSSQ